jgi:endonuclease/exonuclease/phosphatase family metal-dependent hydrolase
LALRKRPARARARRGGEAAARDGGLVLATYNIHTCVGADRRYEPARIAEVLRELDADIIGLQEVDVRHHGARDLDQWAYFAEETGLSAIPSANLRERRGRFGNVLLTRWPARDHRLVDLSIPGHEPRGAIDADLVVGNRVLRVIATHLGLHGRERMTQTKRLLAAVGAVPAEGDGARPPDGIVVMGDLNEWRGRRGGIPAMDRSLGRSPAPRTFPSWCPILPLDRIYATSAAYLERIEVHRSPLARVASDHLPLRATLRWRDE